MIKHRYSVAAVLVMLFLSNPIMLSQSESAFTSTARDPSLLLGKNSSASSEDSNPVRTASVRDDAFRAIYRDDSLGFAIPIFRLDSEGKVIWRSPGFGVHYFGKRCIDSLGETGLPPSPPASIPEMRFVEPGRFDPHCLDQGTYLDLRQFTDTHQADTFKLRINSGYSEDSVVLKWWPKAVRVYEGTVFLQNRLRNPTIRVDMRFTNGVKIPSDESSVYIIASKPRDPRFISHDSTWKPILHSSEIGVGDSLRVGMLVNGQGKQLEMWYRWDTTSQLRFVSDTLDRPSHFAPIQYWFRTRYRTFEKTTYYIRCYVRSASGLDSSDMYSYGDDGFLDTITVAEILSVDDITTSSVTVTGRFNGSRRSNNWAGVWCQPVDAFVSGYGLAEAKLADGLLEDTILSLTVGSLYPDKRYVCWANVSPGIRGAPVAVRTLFDENYGGFIIPLIFNSPSPIRVHGFGVHSGASNCIDSHLGEFERAAGPADGSVDMMFLPPNPKFNCFSSGLEMDIRRLVSEGQSDTFKLLLNPRADREPYRIHWGNVAAHFRGSVTLFDPEPGATFNIDMKMQDSVIVPDSISLLTLIAEYPINPLYSRVTHVGTHVAEVTARVKPKNLPMLARIEWGEEGFTRASEPIEISPGGAEVSFTSVLSDLRPNAIYQYRFVEEDSLNTSYGVPEKFATEQVAGFSPESGDFSADYRLDPLYPNPFNPTTTIPFSVPERSHVTIDIFNVLGEHIETIADEEMPRGDYRYLWHAWSRSGAMASGVYVVRFLASGSRVYRQYQKVVLTR